MTLRDVIADARGEAAVLRRNGHAAQAETLERVAQAVEAAAVDYLTELTEEEARLRCKKSVAWLRARFEGWMGQGHAGWKGKARWYRQVVIPHTPSRESARQFGANLVKGAA